MQRQRCPCSGTEETSPPYPLTSLCPGQPWTPRQRLPFQKIQQCPCNPPPPPPTPPCPAAQGSLHNHTMTGIGCTQHGPPLEVVLWRITGGQSTAKGSR